MKSLARSSLLPVLPAFFGAVGLASSPGAREGRNLYVPCRQSCREISARKGIPDRTGIDAPISHTRLLAR